MKAFHFTKGMYLRDGEEVIVGKTYNYEGKIKICETGFHASKRLLDAMYYAPGFTLSIVECSDIIEEHDDKFVCRIRTVLETHDISDEILLWASDCAEDALSLIENPDKRSIAAIQAVRDYVSGKITIEELKQKRDAAYDAHYETFHSDASTYAALAAANTASNAAYTHAALAALAAASAYDARFAKIKEYEVKLLESIQKKFENNLIF